ncbi:unnamed protein product [Bursaphelenchus okinawaensis]|uniref:3-phosphoinositide-dependent protein kinase 1 n=1 Tax=Bursaphelenchus okinawaensis TaxID=465554 RepID=A0A811KCM5_9BILA|nr:unnamed protein product [Bursaphelenchus okinawaensis]CAG9101062.1 unnamed protein product [Bursaphelenchus okinawaensis]
MNNTEQSNQEPEVRRKLTDILDETDKLPRKMSLASTSNQRQDEDDVLVDLSPSNSADPSPLHSADPSPPHSAKHTMKASTSEESSLSAESTNSSHSRKKSTLSPTEAFQPVVGKFVAKNEKGQEVVIPMTVPNYQFIAAQQIQFGDNDDEAIAASMQVNLGSFENLATRKVDQKLNLGQSTSGEDRMVHDGIQEHGESLNGVEGLQNSSTMLSGLQNPSESTKFKVPNIEQVVAQILAHQQLYVQQGQQQYGVHQPFAQQAYCQPAAPNTIPKPIPMGMPLTPMDSPFSTMGLEPSTVPSEHLPVDNHSLNVFPTTSADPMVMEQIRQALRRVSVEDFKNSGQVGDGTGGTLFGPQGGARFGAQSGTEFPTQGGTTFPAQPATPFPSQARTNIPTQTGTAFPTSGGTQISLEGPPKLETVGATLEVPSMIQKSDTTLSNGSKSEALDTVNLDDFRISPSSLKAWDNYTSLLLKEDKDSEGQNGSAGAQESKTIPSGAQDSKTVSSGTQESKTVSLVPAGPQESKLVLNEPKTVPSAPFGLQKPSQVPTVPFTALSEDYYEDYAPDAFNNYDDALESQKEHQILGNQYGPWDKNETVRRTFARVRRFNNTVPKSPVGTADFYFVRTLGDGSFGSVYHVQDVKTSKEYAIKIMSKKEVKREKKLPYVVREKDIMTTLQHGFGGHPFLAKLHSSFKENNDRICFVMEYAPHGELLEWLRRLGSFDLKVSKFFASEIVEALQFIHKCGIIHRDLKPENILIKNDWHIMLTDFGSAKVQGFEGDDPSQVRKIMVHKNGEMMKKERGSFVGTAFYISPEVAQSHSCGPEADYWALGCILYQMISGQPPFRGVNEYQVTKKIINLDYKMPNGFDEVAGDLVKKLLVLEPSERLGHDGPEAIKEHKFFEDVDFKNIQTTTPPELKPYLPASGNQPAFYSNYKVPENMEPGLTRKTMARLMGLDDMISSPIQKQNPAQLQAQQKEAEARQREAKLQKQRKENDYHKFVEENLILRSGLIDKKKGMFARRRMFLLTEGPRLFYVDPELKELRGEIPITPSLRTEAKNFHTFFIHTPTRTYFLYDPDSHADEWCEAIEKARNKYCNPDAPELDFYPRGKMFTSKNKKEKKRKEKNTSPTSKWGRKSK